MRRAWPRHQQKNSAVDPANNGRRLAKPPPPTHPRPRPRPAPHAPRRPPPLLLRPAPLRRRHGRGLPPAARPARLHLASRRVAATSACGSTLGLRPSPPSSDAAPCGQRGQGTREAQPRRHGPSAGSLRVPASTRAARAPPSSSCSAR